jgi:hypothetical protein
MLCYNEYCKYYVKLELLIYKRYENVAFALSPWRVIVSTSIPSPNADKSKLRQLILDYFNQVELRELCFELSIPYEQLPGDNLSAKVLELIGFCERRGRMEELLGKCQQSRPNAPWDRINYIADSIPGEAEAGFQLLAHLIQEPQIHDTTKDYQQDFKLAQAGIGVVRYYKKQHDLFQEVEASYNVIIHNDRQRLAEDQKAWSNLITDQLLLKGPIDDLIETTAEAHFAARAGYWLPALRRGQDTMHRAIEEQNVDELETALRFLYRALDRGLPRVNSLLVDAVIDLPLNRLVEAMKAIHDRLKPGLPHEAAERVMASVHSLEQLDKSLAELVLHHNDWQSLDDEMRRIDSLLNDNDVSELVLTWPDLQTIAKELFDSSRERWVDDLERLSNRLERALTKEPVASPATINGIFRAYRLQVSRRFRGVDDHLLSLCEGLGKIAEPLDLLLRALL